MCEIQDYDFVVEYEPGEFMAVADTLSRDAVEEPRCRKCNERVILLTEGTRSLPSVTEIKRAQLDEFGVLEKYDEDGQKFILDEEGLLCLATGKRLRIVIPRVMVDQVLEYAHGAKPNGHRGVWKTLSWIKQRFWWKGCAKDVSHRVRKCVHCSLHRLGSPGRQGRMMTWHPLRRFQVVAIDVMEVSPKSRNGCIKVEVMGDLFTRYVWACAVKDEKAETLAKVILDEWVLRFGPLEKLLSDRAQVFVGNIIKCLCKHVGIKKIFTSPYHPQTDGFIERFNRTLMKHIRAYVSTDEADWDEHISMACFRYNTSVNTATGMTPYKAVFGIEAFDFDAEAGRRMAIDEEAESSEKLAKRLATLHRKLLVNGTSARMAAAKQYDKLAEDVEFEIEDRVMVFYPRLQMEKGRKLKTPWLGPYRIEEILTRISYIVRSEIGYEVARVHVNRLRRIDEEVRETGDPLDGIFPDSRRIIQDIVTVKRKSGKRWFKINGKLRTGAEWVREENLPELIVAEYDAISAAKGKKSAR